MKQLSMKLIDKDFPEGGEVIVRLDSDVLFLTKTRSKVERAPFGQEVVFMIGISGWYLISHVYDARELTEVR